MSILLPRDEAVYAQVTIPYAAAIPHSSGTATVANADYLRHIRLQLGGFGGSIINSAAKTRALGRLAGIEGVSGGEPWTLEIPFQMSGTAGTVPDMDAILQAIFGAAPTVNVGTNVIYALADAVPGITLWSFRTDGAGGVTNIAQRCAWGCLLNDFEITTGDGELVLRCGGVSSFVLPSIGFASFSTDQKAGLTSFPTEPAAPAATGNIIPGFIGSATINAVTTFQIESFSIRGNLNRSLRRAYGKRVATVPGAGVREITATIRLFEENVANLNTLRDLQRSKTAFDITLVFGDAAGYIATFVLNNVILPSESLDDSGNEWVLSFNDAPASMTNATSKDEITLTLT